jgi:hypothetical protein
MWNNVFLGYFRLAHRNVCSKVADVHYAYNVYKFISLSNTTSAGKMVYVIGNGKFNTFSEGIGCQAFLDVKIIKDVLGIQRSRILC